MIFSDRGTYIGLFVLLLGRIMKIITNLCM